MGKSAYARCGIIVNVTPIEPEWRGRILAGASPRGSIALLRAAMARAWPAGRDYVLPDDVQRLAPYVLPHRLVMTAKAKYGGASGREVVGEILRRVRMPS